MLEFIGFAWYTPLSLYERIERITVKKMKKETVIKNEFEDEMEYENEYEIEEEIADGIENEMEMIDERIRRAIEEMGFEKLSPIQKQAIPYLLAGEDVIGQAQTGTGKTAAFGIPVIQNVDPDLKKLQAVILCPTRELAIQAAEELRKLAKYMHGIKVLPVYGGQEIGRQITLLRGVQIIVGTPGRVMDHMRRHTIKMDNVNMVVLDEADEMLNMGFREDMELILGEIKGEHQTCLFSATMPKPILDITDKFQHDAKLIKVAASELTIPLVSQRYYKVKSQDKDAACIRLLQYYQPKLCLIFCNTKVKVDEVAEVLKQAGYQAEGLHGDMSQRQRDVAMGRFRNGSTNILIATDVAARGIDVDDVEAVINYDIPQDIEYYVHRIGRTGRAGRTGRSFTLANHRELYKIREIERVCHTSIEERKLPSASKVMKVKAKSYLREAWELHESDDLELMKKFLLAKMEEEDCDAIDLAAAMLKLQVGEMGEEIPEDEAPRRRNRDGHRDGRSGSNRDGRRGDRDGGRDGYDGRRGDRDGRGRDDIRNGRGERDRYGRRGDRDGRKDGRDGKRSDRDGGRDGRDGRRGDRDGRGRDERRNGRGGRDRDGRKGDRSVRSRDDRRDRRGDKKRNDSIAFSLPKKKKHDL